MTTSAPDTGKKTDYTPDSVRDPTELPLQETFHLLRRLTHEIAVAWQQLQPDITKTQYAVMRVIDTCPGIEQVHLGIDAACSKASLAELLNRLEKRGLIRRVADPGDKRRRQVFLTEAGQLLLNENRAAAHAIDHIFLDRLSVEDQQTFHQMLIKMLTFPK